MLTRLQSQAVWIRLCDDVLGAGADAPMRLAFEYNGGVITSLRDFQTSYPQVINGLVYAPAAAPTVQRQLSPGMKNRLVLFQQFIEQLRFNNNNVDLEQADWNAVTKEQQFNEFLDDVHQIQWYMQFTVLTKTGRAFV